MPGTYWVCLNPRSVSHYAACVFALYHVYDAVTVHQQQKMVCCIVQYSCCRCA